MTAAERAEYYEWSAALDSAADERDGRQPVKAWFWNDYDGHAATVAAHEAAMTDTATGRESELYASDERRAERPNLSWGEPLPPLPSSGTGEGFCSAPPMAIGSRGRSTTV